MGSKHVSSHSPSLDRRLTEQRTGHVSMIMRVLFGGRHERWLVLGAGPGVVAPASTARSRRTLITAAAGRSRDEYPSCRKRGANAARGSASTAYRADDVTAHMYRHHRSAPARRRPRPVLQIKFTKVLRRALHGLYAR